MKKRTSKEIKSTSRNYKTTNSLSLSCSATHSKRVFPCLDWRSCFHFTGTQTRSSNSIAHSNFSDSKPWLFVSLFLRSTYSFSCFHCRKKQRKQVAVTKNLSAIDFNSWFQLYFDYRARFLLLLLIWFWLRFILDAAVDFFCFLKSWACICLVAEKQAIILTVLESIELSVLA